MCREFKYHFEGCLHTVCKRQQCVLGYCAQPLHIQKYRHSGECPFCLGAFYPFKSHTETGCDIGCAPESVLPFYQSLAQNLLRFSVTWLVGGYDAVRAAVGPLPSPQPGRERFPAHIHEGVLRLFYAQTACIECGRTSFLESELCNRCPGKTQATINVATQFVDDVVKDVYRRLYLPRVQAGEFLEEQACIQMVYTPETLSRGAAAKLTHQTILDRQVCVERQEKLEQVIRGLVMDINDALVNSPTKEPLSQDQRSCYADFSLHVMHVASWVLAHDAGLSGGVGEHVLRYLAPMLLHPLDADALRLPHWDAYRVDEATLDFRPYRAVAEAYLELEGDEPVTAFLDVIEDLDRRLRKKARLHRAAMSRLRMTKEKLLTARVSLHSEVVADPSEECPICYNTIGEGPVVKYDRCGHAAHKDCLVQGLLAIPVQRCFMCRQQFGGPDESPSDPCLNDHQTASWDDYGLRDSRRE